MPIPLHENGMEGHKMRMDYNDNFMYCTFDSKYFADLNFTYNFGKCYKYVPLAF